jgi:hypothetical protein
MFKQLERLGAGLCLICLACTILGIIITLGTLVVAYPLVLGTLLVGCLAWFLGWALE